MPHHHETTLSGSSAPKRPSRSESAGEKVLSQKFIFLDTGNASTGKVTSANARKFIRSHVMREYRKQSKDSSQPQNTPFCQCSSQKSSITIESLDCSSQKSVPTPQGSDESSTESCCHVVYSDSSGLQRSKPCSQSPNRLLNKSFDAFAYAGVSSVDIESYGLFNHYSSQFHLVLCRHIYPVALPSETNLCCSTAIQENVPALLNSICYYAAGHQGVSRNVMGLSETTPKFRGGRYIIQPKAVSALRYKAQSLHQLNTLLTQEPPVITEGTILCVSILLATDAIFGDIAGIEAHSIGLARMIEAFGGMDQLSTGVGAHLRLVDIKASCTAGARPSLAINPKALQRFEDVAHMFAQLKLHRNTQLGSRFFAAQIFDKIIPELQKYLRYTKYLALVVEVAKAQKLLASFDDVEDFLALEHHLLSLRFDFPISKFEDCIRTALLLYINVGLWRTPLYFAWVESLVTRLKTTGVFIDLANISRQEAEMMLWIFMLGRYAAGAHRHDEKAWFDDKLLDVVGALGVTQWLDAREILCGFFYVDRVFRRPFEKIWTMVVLGSADGDKVELYEHTCPSGTATVDLRKFFGDLRS